MNSAYCILPDAIASAYTDALDLASKETRLPPETFPALCPYHVAVLFDDDYYPGSAQNEDDHG